jgi:plastocyanin
MSKIIITIVVVVIVLVGGYFLLRDVPQPTPSVSGLSSQTSAAQPPVAEPSRKQSTTQPSASEELSQPSPEAPVPAVKENVVVYTHSGGYSPRTLTVKKGETVTFKNQSSRSMWPASDVHPTHRVYSGTSLDEHCPDTTGTAFDACKRFLPGQSWSFIFNKTGTWKYHDHINPDATGMIVVE